MTGAAHAEAAGARTAYFKVTVTALQDVTWKMDATGEACDGALLNTQGSGRSTIRLRTASPQIAVAERAPGSRFATLRFKGGRFDVPVAGTLTRNGSRLRTVTSPGEGGGCGDHQSQPPDCGTRRYPPDARLSVEYLPPEHWRFTDPAPLGPAIVLNGPDSRDSIAGPGFLNCPGVGETRLGVVGSSGGETGFASLPTSKLFASKRFKVSARVERTVESAVPGPAFVSGTWPVTTKIRWTVKFRRLSRAPKGI